MNAQDSDSCDSVQLDVQQKFLHYPKRQVLDHKIIPFITNGLYYVSCAWLKVSEERGDIYRIRNYTSHLRMDEDDFNEAPATPNGEWLTF